MVNNTTFVFCMFGNECFSRNIHIETSVLVLMLCVATSDPSNILNQIIDLSKRIVKTQL